jgi:hypothetical protein
MPKLPRNSGGGGGLEIDSTRYVLSSRWLSRPAWFAGPAQRRSWGCVWDYEGVRVIRLGLRRVAGWVSSRPVLWILYLP